MSTCDSLAIAQAPPERQTDALRLVFQHLDEDAWTDLVGKLPIGNSDSSSPLAGLLEARRQERTVGAVWSQVQPGATAVVWPPGLVDGEPGQTADLLLAAAVEFLQSHQVTMAQTLLEDDGQPTLARLEAAGFSHAADLLYMVSHLASFPTVQPDSLLEFEPSTLQNRARVAHVVEQTYEETRDCPSLGNMRNIEDVLTGYRSTGIFDPTRWLIVRDADRDVGCLLLNEHPGQGHPGKEHPGPEGATPGHLELVYMGVVPEARGNGWGVHITRQAQWITRLAGLERLVLAVDAANRPALDMYSRCGFDAWDRRSAYLRFFSDERDQP